MGLKNLMNCHQVRLLFYQLDIKRCFPLSILEAMGVYPVIASMKER